MGRKVNFTTKSAYERCPKCNSKKIFLAENIMIKYVKRYEILENGVVHTENYEGDSFHVDPIYAYGCYDCDWVDFKFKELNSSDVTESIEHTIKEARQSDLKILEEIELDLKKYITRTKLTNNDILEMPEEKIIKVEYYNERYAKILREFKKKAKLWKEFKELCDD